MLKDYSTRKNHAHKIYYYFYFVKMWDMAIIYCCQIPMDIRENRYVAYTYMETVFPFQDTFRLMCVSTDADTDGGRALDRRTAMTTPGRENNWAENLGAVNHTFLREVVCGNHRTVPGILGKGTAIHIGPLRAMRPVLFEEHSDFEKQRDRRVKEELWRDFVIDIDLDDYDKEEPGPVRFCACVGKKKSCPVCWRYIQAAHAFIEYRLHDRFGVTSERMLWVKSGNKGAHCWIGLRRFSRVPRDLRLAMIAQLTSLPESLDAPADIDDFRALVKKVLTPFLDRVLVDVRFHVVIRGVISVKFGMLAGNIPSAIKNAKSLYTWLRSIIHASWANQVKLYLLRVLVAPRYDKAVMADSSHCAKVPFSVNSSTLRVSIPIIDIGNIQKPPLVSQVVKDPSLIQGELDLFKRWVRAYVGTVLT